MKAEIQVSFKGKYDVIVVGSGPAGMAAAISAGRGGAKTLLIESLGRVGGISTSGMMSHFTGRCGNALFHEILFLAVMTAISKQKRALVFTRQSKTSLDCPVR